MDSPATPLALLVLGLMFGACSDGGGTFGATNAQPEPEAEWVDPLCREYCELSALNGCPDLAQDNCRQKCEREVTNKACGEVERTLKECCVSAPVSCSYITDQPVADCGDVCRDVQNAMWACYNGT